MSLVSLSRSVLLGCALAAFGCETPARSAEPPAPRVVIAVGDLHADLASAVDALTMAGVLGQDGHWAAGTATFVQTGDLTDRGPDSLEVIQLMQRLESEATARGGRVVALLGNHEAMNLVGDWRYVDPEDVADFGSVQARAAAFAVQGPLGSWLVRHDIVAKVDDTVFAHGGVAPEWARVGIDAINDTTRQALVTRDVQAPVLGASGPMWFRGYLADDPVQACAGLQEALDALGARRMVVGHTTQMDGRVAARCDGRLLGIDTGISPHYGSRTAAVRITDGDAWALYPTGPVDLPDPPAAAP